MIFYRNGNRRPTTRRRRKKASPFKVISKWNFPIYFISNIETITLWLLFLVFTLSATIFFLLLVYLDLVSNNKNSRELALCCGAFGWVLALLTGREKFIKKYFRVSLLTALRIWVSLPDELGGDGGSGLGPRPTGLVSPCNCTNTRQDSSSNNLLQQVCPPSHHH